MSRELQSNLELLTPQAFSAGETKVFFLSGDYFELIDCPSAVDVVLQDEQGAQRARMIGAIQTHHVKNTPFKVVQITSATAQSIRFAYGSGEAGTRQTAGAVTVSNWSGAFTQSQLTVTNASAQLIAANATRRYLLIQNKDASGDVHIKLDGAAATLANGLRIPPGASIELQGFVPNGAVFAIGSIASNPNVIVVQG